MRLNISKKQVDKAGDILRITPNNDNSLPQISEWRARYVHPLKLAFNLVEKYTNSIGNHALYGQRLKRISSIRSKLRRNPTMQLSRMQDIGGCRVILSNYDKVFDLYRLLKKSKAILPNEKNYIHYPKEDGYRSIHLIYNCTSKNPDYSGLKIEIQLRTKLQHAWATTLEIIDSFEQQKLKQGSGNEEWREFFRLVSDEFALIERLPIMDRVIDKHKVRLKELVGKLNVLGKLNTYMKAMKLAEENLAVKNAEFSILILDLDNNEYGWQLRPYRELEFAQDEYIRLETLYLNNDKMNVLMLCMHDIKQIKASYPNYFADSHVFIKTLQSILK